MAVAAQPVNYKISESYDKGGIRGPDAAVKYGNRMLTLGEVYPFFGNERLWQKHKHVLQEARPVWTRTKVAFSRKPLGDSIIKDGKDSFLIGTSEGITWRQQIPKKFLDGKTLKKSGQLLVVENGVTTRQDGSNEYTSLVAEENDMRIGDIPKNDWTRTTNHSLLFGSQIEDLEVPLRSPDSNVRVGLVGAGADFPNGLLGFIVLRVVVVPDRSPSRLGVLEYASEAGDAEKTTPSQAGKKIVPVGIDLSDVKALAAEAQKSVEQLAATADEALLQPIRNLIEAVTKE